MTLSDNDSARTTFTVDGRMNRARVSLVEATPTDDGPGRGVTGWDATYAADGAPAGEPHRAVVDVAQPLAPGRALDIACGTGRHSLWLAERGWRVTGLDFSQEGLLRASRAADTRRLRVDWVLADARAWEPTGDGYDLVLLSFVHLPEVFSRATGWLRPDGRLLVVGHAVRNLRDGVGGPRDPALLHDHAGLAAGAAGARLQVLRAAEVARETSDGTVYEAVLVAQRPTTRS